MSRPRRALVFPLALASALALLGDQMLYVFLPTEPGAAGITVGALGIILSANRFVRLGANSVGGLLSDRFGRRGPFLLGMTLAFASTLGYLLASGFWPLLAARVIWGVAFALTSVGGLSIVLDLTTPQDRGRTVGLYQSLVQGGTLAGLLLSGILTDLLGYRGTLAIYVPLTALGWLVALLAVRGLVPAERSRATGPGRSRPGVRGAGSESRRSPTLAALRELDRRLLAPAYVSFASHFAGSGILMATLGVHIKAELGSPADGRGLLIPVASLTGMLLASRRLAGMVEAPLAGYLSDRLGDRRLVAAGGVGASMCGFALLAAGSGAGAIVVGVSLVAIGEGALVPAVAAWMGDGAPAELRGVVMGGLATASDLGAALGPLVGYALAATTGLGWAYGLGAVCMLSALATLGAVRAGGAARA